MLSEQELIASALSLGAERVAGWSPEESKLCRRLPKIERSAVDTLKRKILRGQDPLGEAFCELRSSIERRERGATYTPKQIVSSMVRWAAKHHKPARIVDPGVGSGRFLVEAGKRFKHAELIGVDIDPVATLMARAHLNVRGLSERSEIHLGDYRDLDLSSDDEQTLFIGNPPYVRHHKIEAAWKKWLTTSASTLGHTASQLAGLHIHFLLATALNGKTDDAGAFITSAEWLDVNYGSLARELFLGKLGGQSILVIEPTAQPFPDAATTAAIVTFQIGDKPSSVQLKRIDKLEKLNGIDGGRRVRRERLQAEKRWSHFTRSPVEKREDHVELGELCRVHRGQVTGANRVWIAGEHSEGLPDEVLYPTVTKARELIETNRVLKDASLLRNVISLPVDLDDFDCEEKKAIDRFLKTAKTMGGDSGYVARHRKAWWSVDLRSPAPILATYMARRPPAFVRNLAKARHINIAHGLYPREPLSAKILTALVDYLSEHISVHDGRTYSGGLTKFEPREMERLLVPSPELLRVRCA